MTDRVCREILAGFSAKMSGAASRDSRSWSSVSRSRSPMLQLFRSLRLWAVEPTAVRSAVGVTTGGGEAGATGSTAVDQPAGDPDDLHALVDDHGDAIFRLALSVVRDRALAEDIAQETLVKAWLALPSFRGESSLRGWVLRIAHNTAVSTLRRRRAILTDPHDLPEEPVRAERSVESRVLTGAAMDDFVEALDTLDDLSRSIVVLRELDGMSYEEIAEVLEIPMPTVKTRLLRARRRLGNALREWNG